MALSEKLKNRIRSAITNKDDADALIAAIESGSNPQGAAVADLGPLTGTYAIPAEPTGAEVDASVQVVADKVDALLASLRAAGIIAS